MNKLNFEILVVDDNLDNLLLLVELLKMDGYNVSQLSSGVEALKRIEIKKPHLILLDIRMDGMDGLAVCKSLKNNPETSDIPVIFISGLMDEQQRIKGFEAGAVDFITKPFMRKEVLARVRTHLKMASLYADLKVKNQRLQEEIELRRQKEAAIKESEERFSTTLYSIGDGVITTDTEGRVVMMNPIAEKLTGYSQHESKGRRLEEIFHIINEETLNEVEIPVRKVLREGVIVGLANHTLLISKEGNQIPIADSGAPVRDGNGKIVGVVLVFRDQTDERRAEMSLRTSEKKFRAIVESSPFGMYLYQLTPDNQLIFMEGNPSSNQIIGIDHSELVGLTIEEAFPSLVGTGIPELYKSIAAGKEGVTSFEIPYRDNQINGFYNVTVFRTDENRIVVFFIDETNRKKIEEEKFRLSNIVENSLNEIYIFDSDTLKFSYVNQGALQNIGYTMEEMVKMTPLDIKPTFTEEGFRFMVQPLLDGQKKMLVFETLHQRKNGPTYWVEVHLHLHQANDQKLFLAFINDISERKASEQQIKQSEEKFRNLFENASVGISMTMPDGSIHINQAFCDMLGYLPGEMANKNWKEITHPDDIKASSDVTEMLKSGKENHFRYEKRYIHKNGATIWADVSTTLLRDDDGKPLYFITNVSDISGRKDAELKLLKSENKFRKLIENSTDVISLIDSKGTVLYNSPSHLSILGYPPESRIEKNTNDLLHPDDSNLFTESQRLLLQGQDKVSFPAVRLKHFNGNWIWVEGVAKNMLDDPDINAIVVNYRDVTDRINAEEELKNSEEKFYKSFHNAPIMIGISDLQTGLYIDVNEEVLRFSGFSRSDVIGHIASDVGWITKDERDKLIQEIKSKGRLDNYEMSFVKKDKTPIQVLINGETININGRECLLTLTIDITERKKAQEKLLQSQKELLKAQQAAHVGSWVLDINSNHLKWSDEMFNIFGIDKDYDPDNLQEAFISVIHPDDLDRVRFSIDSVVKEHNPLPIEFRIIKPDGEIRTVWSGAGELEFDSNGNETLLRGIVQDVTERKKIEEDIRKERTLLRTLIDHLPINVYVKDREGRKLIANKADLDFIGKSSEEEVIGKTDIELFPGGNGVHGLEVDLEIMRSGNPILNLEESFYDNRGDKRWLVTSKIPLRDENGIVYGLVGTGRDVTGKHRDHETIQKLMKSIEQSPSTIVITDIEGTIQYVNPKFTEITGYSPDEVIGKNPRILKSGEMSAEKYKELWDTISSGGVWRGEFHNKKKNGELYWEWATMTSIKNDRGEIINYIAIKEDISLRKQMEKDLLAAKEKAEENDRLKSAFLANMSHEIRTPLNSIMGFSELLCDPDIDVNERNEFSKLITSSGKNLLCIINDILDISKIEAGQLQVKIKRLPVQSIIRTIGMEFSHPMAERGLQFVINDRSVTDSDEIETDEERVKQILSNFLTNAIKFTDEGSIEFGVVPKQGTFLFYVKDSGIGISEENMPYIFDRFRQLETSFSRRYGGNGLGLTISKSLAEMLGGKIWVESEEGKGSTFFLSLSGTPVTVS